MPPQYKPQPIVDFRDFPDGPRGYKVSIKKNGTIGSKRKLDEYEEQASRAAERMRTARMRAPRSLPRPRMHHARRWRASSWPLSRAMASLR